MVSSIKNQRVDIDRINGLTIAVIKAEKNKNEEVVTLLKGLLGTEIVNCSQRPDVHILWNPVFWHAIDRGIKVIGPDMPAPSVDELSVLQNTLPASIYNSTVSFDQNVRLQYKHLAERLSTRDSK